MFCKFEIPVLAKSASVISDKLGALWTSPHRAFSEEFVVGDSLTLADLAIYNAIDECVLGPRGNQPKEVRLTDSHLLLVMI